MIAIMIGVIMIARITMPTPSPPPPSWITIATDSWRSSLIRCSSTNGTTTSRAISP